MPTDDDENTVTVEELDDMLTHDQKDELRALLLPAIACYCLCQSVISLNKGCLVSLQWPNHLFVRCSPDFTFCLYTIQLVRQIKIIQYMLVPYFQLIK